MSCVAWPCSSEAWPPRPGLRCAHVTDPIAISATRIVKSFNGTRAVDDATVDGRPRPGGRPARPERLGEDHAAPGHRRVRGARRGHGVDRWADGRRERRLGRARPSPRRHGVPGRRALPPPDGGRQRRVRQAPPGSGRGVPAAGRSRRPVALVPPRAVGRRAPAGRPGPGPRHRAGGGPARRALRLARRRAADHAAGGGRGHPPRRRRQRPAGDPRPAGGPLVGRHRGADARRLRRAGRLSRGGLRRARRRGGRPSSSAPSTSCRAPPPTASSPASSVGSPATTPSPAVRSTCWCAPRPWSSAPTRAAMPTGGRRGIGRDRHRGRPVLLRARPARVARAGERAPRAQPPARLRGLVARRSGEGLGRGPGPGARPPSLAEPGPAAGGGGARYRPGRDGRRSV